MNARPRKKIDTSTYTGRFAERLKMLREKAKLTPEEAAERIGITPTTVYHRESLQRSPRIEAEISAKIGA